MADTTSTKEHPHMVRRSAQELARDSAQRAARHMELAARAERPWIKALDSVSTKLVEILDKHADDFYSDQLARLTEAQQAIDAIYVQLVKPTARASAFTASEAAAAEAKPAIKQTNFAQETPL